MAKYASLLRPTKSFFNPLFTGPDAFRTSKPHRVFFILHEECIGIVHDYLENRKTPEADLELPLKRMSEMNH
jgi:hypothetical protein